MDSSQNNDHVERVIYCVVLHHQYSPWIISPWFDHIITTMEPWMISMGSTGICNKKPIVTWSRAFTDHFVEGAERDDVHLARQNLQGLAPNWVKQ